MHVLRILICVGVKLLTIIKYLATCTSDDDSAKDGYSSSIGTFAGGGPSGCRGSAFRRGNPPLQNQGRHDSSTLALFVQTPAPPPFSAQETQSELNISFGDLTVQVAKSPWLMKVIDAVSGHAILTETSIERHKLVYRNVWNFSYL